MMIIIRIFHTKPFLHSTLYNILQYRSIPAFGTSGYSTEDMSIWKNPLILFYQKEEGKIVINS